jgi:hypothetical protein
METNKENVKDRSDNVISQSENAPEDTSKQDGGEFKIEIRRLEVPVRPRGVLAE